MTHCAPDEIRRQVTAVRAGLTGAGEPDFAAQIQALEAAAAQLQALARRWAEAPPGETERAELRAEISALETELRRLARLVEAGDEFWRGWARLLGLDTGYTPAGIAAPLLAPGAAARRLTVKG
jgi:Lon protease-like protein